MFFKENGIAVYKQEDGQTADHNMNILQKMKQVLQHINRGYDVEM